MSDTKRVHFIRKKHREALEAAFVQFEKDADYRKLDNTLREIQKETLIEVKWDKNLEAYVPTGISLDFKLEKD